MTKILGLSGKKQSGKNTAFNLLLGIEMLKLAIVREKIEITDNGKLWISDIFGDVEYQGIFDADRDNPTMRAFLGEYIHPFIKNYSFADALKRDICINILGLSYDMCYGSDEDKNLPTHLKWEDMPGVVTRTEVQKNNWDTLQLGWLTVVYHEPGYMTARDVMQFLGTQIFRKMYDDVWAKSCINKINRDQPDLAVITDCRFPNEVEAIKQAGGKIIRFTRGSNTDEHESEKVLDKDRYDWDNFDAVLDNANMTIGEQNQAILNLLYKWGWMDEVSDDNFNNEEATSPR